MADPAGAPRYQTRLETWGHRKRFAVVDTRTGGVVVVRSNSQSADSDLLRLNLGTPPAAVAGTARQCGRCRASFPLDPSLDATKAQDWWLCEPCHDKLFARSTPATGSVGG